jgi:hypothetical protein
MRKYFCHTLFTTWLGLLLFYMPGCKKAGDIEVSAPKPERAIESFFGTNIDINRPKIIHLYKDTVYTLSQFLTRRADEQLIIDEGTIIKVDPNEGTNITINPGGTIIANGTPANPIVFTSSAYTGTQNANWGGIIIQGRSNDNSSTPNGDPTDFSGSLSHVRIEFGSLTLTGVGSGTLLENIMVSYTNNAPSSSKSAFEIDGGTFYARNLISYACSGPADFYITRGYSGKMQNILAYRHPFFGSTSYSPPNALAGVFIENNPYDTLAMPNTNPVISNLTVLGPNAQNGSTSAYADTNVRSAALVTTVNALFHIRNSLFLGFPLSAWYLDDNRTAQSIQYGPAEATYSIFQSNDTARTFYLKPDAYPPYTSEVFNDFMMDASRNNQLYLNAGDFMFKDPFNYDSPDPLPKNGSPVLQGADFSGASFGDAFFNKVAYKGALGTENWLQGWTNFTPLKTNYNIAK